MTDELTTPPESESAPAAEEELKWPVSFMLVLGLTAVYVGFRIVQMVGKLFG
jgi:hypothetical protein